MRRGHFERHMYQWSSSLPPDSSLGKRRTATFKDIWAPYDSFSCSITTEEQTSWFSSCCIGRRQWCGLHGDEGYQEARKVKTLQKDFSTVSAAPLEPKSRLPGSLPVRDWGVPGSQESENVTFQPVNFDFDLRKSSVEFVSHVRNKELGASLFLYWTPSIHQEAMKRNLYHWTKSFLDKNMKYLKEVKRGDEGVLKLQKHIL